MADVDFDFDLDPSPAADGSTSPVLTASESSAHPETSVLAPAVIVLPAAPVPPVASGAEDVAKSSAPAGAEGGRAPPAAMSVDTPVEESVVAGFKGALVKATDLELRLRELASDAELMKTQMHVSTYVSPLICRVRLCLLNCLRGFAM